MSVGIDGAPGSEPVRDRHAALLLLPLTLILILVVGVFWVAYRTARVDGDSMEPGLLHGDRLLVTKTYGVPHRGDVVLVIVDEPDGPAEVLKRVVGLPGDVVAVEGGIVTIDGRPETYPFRIDLAAMDPGYTWGPYAVPAGTVFLMGDNRPISLDSRYRGAIPLENVLGRAVGIFAPVDRIRSVAGGS